MDEAAKQKQADGIDKYIVSKFTKEMDGLYDTTDYKALIKTTCSWCGSIVNPDKKYSYYITNGNACRPLCFKAGTKSLGGKQNQNVLGVRKSKNRKYKGEPLI